MRSAELGIVVMMMIMRTAPDAAGAHRENAKQLHEPFSQLRIRQDRMMLLIMIDHEQSQNEQTGEDTADDLAGQMNVPQCSGHGYHQQKGRRQNAPPAFCRRILRKRLCCQYQFFTCSHSIPSLKTGQLIISNRLSTMTCLRFKKTDESAINHSRTSNQHQSTRVFPDKDTESGDPFWLANISLSSSCQDANVTAQGSLWWATCPAPRFPQV